MVDTAQNRAADAYDNAGKLGSDAVDRGADVLNQTPHQGTGMPGETTSINDAAQTARDTGQDAATIAGDAGDAGENLFDKIKEKVSDLIDGGDVKR